MLLAVCIRMMLRASMLMGTSPVHRVMQCPDLRDMDVDKRANLNQAYLGTRHSGEPEQVLQRWRQEIEANGAGGSNSNSSHHAGQAHQCTLCHASSHRCMLLDALLHP